MYNITELKTATFPDVGDLLSHLEYQIGNLVPSYGAGPFMMADEIEPLNTLATSFTLHLSPSPTHTLSVWPEIPYDGANIIINITSNDGGSTGKGILIGMLSAFGSAAFVVFIFAIFYFFRHTSRGRIFLDRIGRPGEFDDEQALAREEAEALGGMDDHQTFEYLKAKGMNSAGLSSLGSLGSIS